MDPASPDIAGTDHIESSGDRITRLRAFTTYAEELQADYYVHLYLRIQKQLEYLKDAERLREQVLPHIGRDCDKDNMRYTAVVATHNELIAKFKALVPQIAYYFNAMLKLRPVVKACRRELDIADENK